MTAYYDRIGNPYRIYFTNGNVTKYRYNAAGQKLGVEYYVATPNITVPFGAEPDALTQGQTMYAGSRQYLLGIYPLHHKYIKDIRFFSIGCKMCFSIIKSNNGINFANFINNAYFQI